MNWIIERGDFETLGYLPAFLNEDDPRPAKEQLDANYQHGGGWRNQPGFTMKGRSIQYPGDPPMIPVAYTMLREETIRVYPYAYVCIVQPDGSFEICRMD
jgi:hypothetical protein